MQGSISYRGWVRYTSSMRFRFSGSLFLFSAPIWLATHWSSQSLACNFAFQEQACTSLRFNQQRSDIPLNAADGSMTLQWGLYPQFGPFQPLEDEDFPSKDDVDVRRTDGDESASVEFDIVEDATLPAATRRLVIVDAVPGEYSISTVAGTCAAQDLGQVTIHPSAELPSPIDDSPDLHWVTQDAGEDACGQPRGPQGSLEVELPLSDDWLPWRDVLLHSLRLGSDEAFAYGLVTQASSGDGIAFRGITPFACGNDNPNDLPLAPAGPVNVSLELTANGLVRPSASTPFQMPCGNGVGCDCVLTPRRPAYCLALLAVWLISFRRRPRMIRLRSSNRE